MAENGIPIAGKDENGDKKDIGMVDDAAKVLDQSVSPGEDSTLDKQFVTDGFLYKQLTATGTVKSGAGYIAGIILVSGGAADVDLTLYDNTSASGAKLHVSVDSDATASSIYMPFPKPIKFNNGVHAVIGGTTPVFNFILAMVSAIQLTADSSLIL